MSVNGSNNSQEPSMLPSGSVTPPFGHSGPAAQAIARLSLDSERSATPPLANSNGIHMATNGRDHGNETGLDPVAKLQLELEQTKEEKEALAAQYRTLLAKLQTMRTTLGNKLKQDGQELDRREQIVQQLTAQNNDLSQTVETLKEELIASHEEADRASSELDSMRNRALQANAQENTLRERELREIQSDLERCRMERDEWENTAMQEKVVVDETKSALEMFKRDLELEREARRREAGELEFEHEKASNLQSVLEDFQAAKDHELRQAVKGYESQLMQVTQSLADYKHRALTAELQLEESHSNTSRTRELEKEVKEKNLLIGKLRHEAVIINEHLMEALRRLRRNSTDTNVDRRLVTNVLLSFLATPRADPKRFEMLSLLATVLSWTDPEREKAGLQRAHNDTSVPGNSSFWSRSPAASPAKELDKADETESFSRRWVEFLLTEAASGETTPSRSSASPPASPTLNSHRPGFSSLGLSGGGSKKENAKRLASSFMASSPDLMLAPPPSRKGKEKEAGS